MARARYSAGVEIHTTDWIQRRSLQAIGQPGRAEIGGAAGPARGAGEGGAGRRLQELVGLAGARVCGLAPRRLDHGGLQH